MDLCVMWSPNVSNPPLLSTVFSLISDQAWGKMKEFTQNQLSIHRGFAPTAWHQRAQPSTQGLPLPASQVGDCAQQTGLGVRHHLHPHRAWICVPHRRGGSVQPQGVGTQGCDHRGGASRQRGAARGRRT